MMTPSSLRALKLPFAPATACLLALITPSLWAQTAPVCGPTPQVEAEIAKIRAVDRAPDEPLYQWVRSQQSALEALAHRYPDDIFVEKAYMSSRQWYGWDTGKVLAEYKARHEEEPGSARVGYLYGVNLVGRDTPQAIKLFSEALHEDPNFLPTHLELVTIYTAPNFLDKAQAISHEKAFLAACPDAIEGYRSLQQLDDKELIAQSVPKLRQILEPRKDSAALEAYSTLWALEFKARPLSEYDAVRKQVAADVVRLRSFDLQSERNWWNALEEGYKLTNDQKQSDWADDQLQTHFPSAWSLPEESRWFKAHPYPASDASDDTRTAYFTELLKQTDAWIKQRPASSSIWQNRLDALTNVNDSTPAEIGSCLAKALELQQADNGPNPLDSNTDFQFARTLSDRKLDAQRQLDLAQKGLDQLAIESKQPPYDMYVSKKQIEEQEFWNTFAKFSGRFYIADAYIRLKQTEKAQNALVESDAVLQALKSQVNDKDNFRHPYANQESSYWTAMAHLAELQNRKLDAMAFYQSALLDSLDAVDNADLKGRARLEKDARVLWASLGGTDNGWKSWYGDRAAALANESHLTWETAQDPLPPFQLTDLQGKTWQLADLKGKVVFLNFWASW